MMEWKKLGDLGPYFGGLTGKTKEDFVEGNAKFITYMNVFANPSLDISSTGVVKINEGEKQNKIQLGDILFTGSSETPEEAGMSCVVADELDEDYYMNSFCFGIRLDNPKQYNLHYLKHVLRSNDVRKKISKSASGVTRFNISKARFGKIQIPIPSISEQNRIVGILDTFTATIDNLKEQIGQRRKQYEYYRDQLLDLEGKEGVEMKTLGDIMQIVRGASPRPIKNFITAREDGINWIKIGDVAPRAKYITCCNEKITKEGAEKSRFLHAGDFILSNSMSFGRPYILKIDGCIHDGWIAMSDFEKYVLPDYLYEYLNSDIVQKYWIMKANNGGAMTNLNSDIVRETPIRIPSFSDQQRIVSILDTFEASIQNLEAQLSQREKQYEYYREQLLNFE